MISLADSTREAVLNHSMFERGQTDDRGERDKCAPNVEEHECDVVEDRRDGSCGR